MPAVNPLDFVGALDRLTRIYDKARRLALGTAGLSQEELSVLSEANRRPGTPIDMIASVLSMSGKAAGQIVKKLVKKGLLSDSDSEVVEPTPKGRETGVEVTQNVWTAFAQALGGAASIATAMAGLISTIASILDRWVDHALPRKEEAPKKKRPARKP